MKPSMDRKTLQTALVLIGAILVGVAEAPGVELLVSPNTLHWLQLFGAVLGSSQLFKRLADYAPSEVTLVEDGRTSVAPPQ